MRKASEVLLLGPVKEKGKVIGEVGGVRFMFSLTKNLLWAFLPLFVYICGHELDAAFVSLLS